MGSSAKDIICEAVVGLKVYRQQGWKRPGIDIRILMVQANHSKLLFMIAANQSTRFDDVVPREVCFQTFRFFHFLHSLRGKMKKQRRKYKLDDHRVLSLHETTTTTIDAKKEKLFLIKHNQNIDIFFEGRRTVWTEHATFNIFIVNHCYIIPNILEIIAFHSPTATDDHIYVPLPSILRELNHDDLKIRIQSQREKLLSMNRSCYDQEIYQKCANELIVQSLLQRIRISSNNSTLSRSHSVTVNLSYESNSNFSTCDKPVELIPVEIGSRKIAS